MPSLKDDDYPHITHVVVSCRKDDYMREEKLYELARKYAKKSSYTIRSINTYYRGEVVEDGYDNPDADRFCCEFPIHSVYLTQMQGEARLMGFRMEEH